MFSLPNKYSKKWAIIAITIFLFNFIVLTIFNFKYNYGSVNIKVVGEDLVFPFIFSVIIGLGGFLGAKAYFYTALALNIIGDSYLVFKFVTRDYMEPAFIFPKTFFVLALYFGILFYGIVIGIIIQSIMYFVLKKKRKL